MSNSCEVYSFYPLDGFFFTVHVTFMQAHFCLLYCLHRPVGKIHILDNLVDIQHK